MPDELIDIARFASANEAAVARNALESAGIPAFLDGDATATWFWHFGSALGGVKLFVRHGDAERATAVLSHCDAEDIVEEWPAEAGPPDDDSDEPQVDDETLLSESTITRAWRASIMGILFFPPLLNLYSMWLLLNRRSSPSERTRPVDWRVGAAFVVNLGVFAVAALLVYFFVVQSATDQSHDMPGLALEVHYHVNIPLVPVEPASVDVRYSDGPADHDLLQSPPAAIKPSG